MLKEAQAFRKTAKRCGGLNYLKLLSDKYGMNINEQQKMAASHGKGPALVLAGPGSGKTTVILARCAYLVMEAGVDLDNILTLTFNRAARHEMENRYKMIFGSDFGDRNHFSTIHSFCNMVVRDYEIRQGQRFVRIEGNDETKDKKRNILRSIYREINDTAPNDDELENLINDIGFVKNRMLKNLEGFDSATRNFKEIFAVYEKHKKTNLYMDYDDMLVYAYHILGRCPDILSRCRNRYRYLQVDEGQDLSKIQFEILKLLVQPGRNNLFIVADDDQSIYGFRGAEPQYIMDIERQFDDCKLYKLENNYRSAGSIVEISSRFIKANRDRYDKDHRTENESGINPVIVRPQDEAGQLSFITHKINETLEKDENHIIGVLYRNNLSSIEIADTLEKNNISFKIKQNKLFFFRHWVVQDILAFLNFAIDQTNADAFMRIYYKMNRYISKTMIEYAKNSGYEQSLIDGIIECDEVTSYQKRDLAGLRNEFKRLARKKSFHALEYIEDDFNYRKSIKEYCENTGLSKEYFYELLGILKRIAKEYTAVPLFIERLRHLERIFEKGSWGNGRPEVELTTIHSSKGLEYDCVIMADLYNCEIPGQRSLDLLRREDDGSLVEEERRLFYVGMTRAKEYVYLVCPENRNNTAEPGSLFVNEVAACINGRMLNEISEGVIARHTRYGRGVITAVIEDSSAGTILEIDFKGKRRKLDLAVCMENGLLSFGEE
jgi:DNA helicase II / ATP-dependent DNA helicase PcrA